MLCISSIQYWILDFEKFSVARISASAGRNGELGTTCKACSLAVWEGLDQTDYDRGTCLIKLYIHFFQMVNFDAIA